MASEVMGLLGSLNIFDPKVSNFSIFSERLKQFFVANKITDPDRKKAILLNTLSEDCYILVRNLCVPVLPEEKTMEELVKILSDHFSSVKSHFAERLKFYNAKRQPHESVNDWQAKVKSLASNCKFSTELQVVMRDIFVIGINDDKIMDRLFEESVSRLAFDQAVKLALIKESAVLEHESRGNISGNIKPEPVYFQKSRGNKFQKQSKPIEPSQPGPSGYKMTNKCVKCAVCGRKSHTTNNCAYKNCTCHNCGVKGHLAPQCKRSRSHFMQEDIERQQSSDDEESIFNIRELDVNNIQDSGNIKPFFIKLQAEQIPLNFEIDSGFAHSAISEKIYLKHFKKCELYKNDLSLTDYVGITFKPLGFLLLNIIHENTAYVLKTYVIKNGGPPLIGRNALSMLNIGFCKQENHRNYCIGSNVENCKMFAINLGENAGETDFSTKLSKLIEKYKNIFDAKLGTFNKFQVSLPLKEGATPKFCKQCPSLLR